MFEMRPLVIINVNGMHVEVDDGAQTILEQHRSICSGCSASCEHFKQHKLEMYECVKAEALIEKFVVAFTERSKFNRTHPKLVARLDQLRADQNDDDEDFHKYPLRTRWQAAQMLKQLIPTKGTK